MEIVISCSSSGMEAQHLGASLASLCCVTMATSILVSIISKLEVIPTLWVC